MKIQSLKLFVRSFIVTFICILVITLALAPWAQAPLLSTSAHTEFFEAIRAHCGKTYAGRVTVDNAPASVLRRQVTNHGCAQVFRPRITDSFSRRQGCFANMDLNQHQFRHFTQTRSSSCTVVTHMLQAGLRCNPSLPINTPKIHLSAGKSSSLWPARGKCIFTQANSLIV